MVSSEFLHHPCPHSAKHGAIRETPATSTISSWARLMPICFFFPASNRCTYNTHSLGSCALSSEEAMSSRLSGEVRSAAAKGPSCSAARFPARHEHQPANAAPHGEANQNHHCASDSRLLHHNCFLLQAAAKAEPPRERSLARTEEELRSSSPGKGKASSPSHTARAAPRTQRGLLWSVSQHDWKA